MDYEESRKDCSLIKGNLYDEDKEFYSNYPIMGQLFHEEFVYLKRSKGSKAMDCKRERQRDCEKGQQVREEPRLQVI
jgi:hypothetical protein